MRGILMYVSATAMIIVSCVSLSGAPRQTPSDSGAAIAAPQAQPDVARMDQVIQWIAENNPFMGAVLVARGNDKLLDKGYGFADLEWNIPDSPKTKFRLGSITKQFTAVSILLLEERGKLNVNDQVKKYMPDAPTAWDKMTIFNLLTHTSGLPDFTDFPDYASLEPFPTTPGQLVSRFRDKPLGFQPGEKESYSNSGYVLLGYLIEKISGESYSRFLQENIFKPLGMNDSGYDSNFAIIPDRASGYVSGPDGLAHAGYINMTTPFAAGGLYSTTEDLLRWEQGLFGGKVLSPASLKEMTTPFKNNTAFGLSVNTIDGHTVFGHGGEIEGFDTLMLYYPDDKLTLVVLANVNGGAPQTICKDLGILALGGKLVLPSERKIARIDPKIFDGYVGNYQLAPGVSITVSRDGDHLFEGTPGQPKVEIFPESETDYFMKVADVQITFVTDSQGRATELVLHLGRHDQHAKRTE